MKSLLLILTLAASFSAFGQSGKMKPEELVKRHLDSIGAAEDRAGVKSIISVGESKAAARLYSVGEFSGVSQIGSEGNKVILAHIFNSKDYPYEKAGYNGDKLTISQLPEGRRSLLGDFFRSNDSIFEEGLIGGTLSSAWALLNIDSRRPRLSYFGTEKINDRQTHKLKYASRKGGEMQISIFFDAENFRHVRTEYLLIISPRIGSNPIQTAKNRERRYKLVEEFSDFKNEGKLTLPHSYRMHYVADEQTGTRWVEWTINLRQFVFNQSIDTSAFTLDTRN